MQGIINNVPPDFQVNLKSRMGNIADTIKEQQDKNDAETSEKLQTIHKMMVDKIAATSAKMQNDAIEDKTLPIVSVVDKSQKYKIKVTSAPDQAISDGIGELLSGNFLGGLKSLITVGLNEFLGNTTAGETEKIDFHVIYANNSLLRLDYMMYKYEFASRGLKTNYKNAFCYYMQVGVLDLEKVNSQILLYELTRAIGEQNLPEAAQHLEGLAVFAKELYKTVHELKTAAITGDVAPSGGGGKPPKPTPKPPVGGGEGYTGGGDKDKECKPGFQMLVLDDITREARNHEEEEKERSGQEYRRTEEFGVILVEQEESKIESS